MNYLDRLKQIDGQKIFAHTPESELTKPTKAPSVSSVSTPQGISAKTQSERVRSEQAENDDGVISFAWLMHFIDRNPLVVTFSPEASHAVALSCYPDAVAAEPIEPIAETEDSQITTTDYPDDRRTCNQCANLRGGVCTIAKPDGIIPAVLGYRPGEIFRERLHRCEGFDENTSIIDFADNIRG